VTSTWKNSFPLKVMTFHAKEFNRPSPSTNPIPSNRKRG
jgi:hypothetical protein